MGDMIYLPHRAFSLWDALGGALVRAAHEALFDFDKNNPKPWAYYPGVATGVIANNMTGAGAVIYFVGATIDVVIRHGPNASDIGWFIDGVAQADISAYAASEAWEHLHLSDLVQGVVHTLQLFNKPSASQPDNDGVMTIGEVMVSGDDPRAAPFASELSAAVWTLTFTIRDENAKDSTHSVYLPMAHYEYDDASYFAELYVQRLEPLLRGVIRTVTIARTLYTAAIAAAQPGIGSDINRGMYVNYRVYGSGGEYAHTLATYDEAYTIPDWGGGDRVPHWEDPEVSAFFDLMASAVSEGFPANPCDRRGQIITGIAKAYQSYRS